MTLLIPRRARSLSGGLTVGRLLPYARRRMVGPFIFLDHMGPHTLKPGAARDLDVLPHPHIGLSTLTYLFEGEIRHRDSIGSDTAIRPGAVNWMTSGCGVSHSERFERARLREDRLEGVQAWVALPGHCEEMQPHFEHHGTGALPQWQHGGVRGRLLAGAGYGLVAPTSVLSPLHYIHLDMAAGSRTELVDTHEERAIYVVCGAVEVGHPWVHAGEMRVLDNVADSIEAQAPSTVMLLGGDAVGPRHIHWNFVSSNKARLEQAAHDWQRGAIALPQGDDAECIPLPTHPSSDAPVFS